MFVCVCMFVIVSLCVCIICVLCLFKPYTHIYTMYILCTFSAMWWWFCWKHKNIRMCVLWFVFVWLSFGVFVLCVFFCVGICVLKTRLCLYLCNCFAKCWIVSHHHLPIREVTTTIYPDTHLLNVWAGILFRKCSQISFPMGNFPNKWKCIQFRIWCSKILLPGNVFRK